MKEKPDTRSWSPIFTNLSNVSTSKFSQTRPEATRPSAYFPRKRLSRTCKRTESSTDATRKSLGRSSPALTGSSRQGTRHRRTMTRTPRLWATKTKKSLTGKKIPVIPLRPAKTSRPMTLRLRTISRFSKKSQRRVVLLRPFPWGLQVTTSPLWSHSSRRGSWTTPEASRSSHRSSWVANSTIFSQKCTNSSE